MDVHLPIVLGWSRCRDANPVPSNPFTDDCATAPMRPVSNKVILSFNSSLND